jgi:hypothetical protein
MSKRKIYFARPITMYNVTQDRNVINTLKDQLDIIDPASEDMQNHFEAYRANHPNNYMQFFIDKCNLCDGVMFFTFPDNVIAENVPQVTNRVGAGVAKEVESFWTRPNKGSVWHIPIQQNGSWERQVITDWRYFNILTVNETRAMLKAMK